MAIETRHLQRKLTRVTKESEAKLSEERSALEARLAETSRRAEAKLRAERARLAVRYGNAGTGPGGRPPPAGGALTRPEDGLPID